MDTLNLLYLTTGVTIAFAIVVLYYLRRLRRGVRDTERLTLTVAEGQHIPPSLHPVIDTQRCIGSLSCVKACPEGDILGLVDGRATLVEASHCIGHSKCATECPVDAIKLVFGTKEKGVDLPETDEKFESTKAGIFIIGELGGMGLIKNAIRQGLDVAETLKARAPKLKAGAPDAVDVLIVGAGPSGIAAAVGCTQAGLSYAALEQGTVGGTVANYPRGKVVMSEKVVIPGYGAFGRSLLSKEELMDELSEVMIKNRVRVESGVRVTNITGDEGDFVVETSKGTRRARMVVLAIGLRGTPRKIGCSGESTTKVTYNLVDPDQYQGRKVLVVGGGDSAVEAAIQLAEETDAEVAISYRKDSFSRCKPRNRQIIADLIEKKKVRALMGTSVTAIYEDRVHLQTASGKSGGLWNDNILVCIGGELPTKFLKEAGVTVRRFHAEEKKRSAAPGERPKTAVHVRQSRRLGIFLSVIGVAIFAGLMWVGQDYYTLPFEERRAHKLHEWLRPAGLWGHGVGIIATLVMMSNFIYVLRKRLGFLKGSAPIRTWLTFHMFVGIMSPVVIAFHAAFQTENLLAVGTWISLGVVVGTGVFGRFLFGLVPSHHGKLEALVSLQERWIEQRKALQDAMDGTTDVGSVRLTLDAVTKPPPEVSFWQLLTLVPRRRLQLGRMMEKVRPYFLSEEQYRFFKHEAGNVIKLRLQVAAYRKLKNIFRVWIGLHVSLAIFMVLLIAGHIGLSLYLGYQWIWSA